MLINLRNALMGGKRLPYDAEVEFLESTGDQYINTGVAPVDDATFVICAAFTYLSTGRFGLVQLIGPGDDTLRYYFGVLNGKWIGAINSTNYNHNISQADTGIHIFKTNNLGLYIDDVMVVAAENSKPTLPVYLANIDGSITAISTKAKLYSCKIYDTNGVLIRDLIPVRKGTTGEMYDRVSGKFAERYGDFVVGQDVVPVEYIESHGTEYIDTLVNADSNLSVEITMANAGTTWANVNPTGAILMTPRRRHHLNFNNGPTTNGVNYHFGNGDDCIVTSGYKPTDGEIFTFKADAINKTFTLGSFLGTLPNDTFDTGLSYWLFGRNSTTPYLGSLRKGSAKLWNGSTLVRSFRPVRVGTEGAMMDVLTRRIYRNAGTGAFTYGNDLKYPIPAE